MPILEPVLKPPDPADEVLVVVGAGVTLVLERLPAELDSACTGLEVVEEGMKELVEARGADEEDAGLAIGIGLCPLKRWTAENGKGLSEVGF